MGPEDAIDKVVVADNVFSDADSGGIELADSSTYADVSRQWAGSTMPACSAKV